MICSEEQSCIDVIREYLETKDIKVSRKQLLPLFMKAIPAYTKVCSSSVKDTSSLLRRVLDATESLMRSEPKEYLLHIGAVMSNEGLYKLLSHLVDESEARRVVNTLLSSSELFPALDIDANSDKCTVKVIGENSIELRARYTGVECILRALDAMRNLSHFYGMLVVEAVHDGYRVGFSVMYDVITPHMTIYRSYLCLENCMKGVVLFCESCTYRCKVLAKVGSSEEEVGLNILLHNYPFSTIVDETGRWLFHCLPL